MKTRHAPVLISALFGTVVGVCSHLLNSSPAPLMTPRKQQVPPSSNSALIHSSQGEIAELLKVDRPELTLFHETASPGEALKSILTPPVTFPISAVMEALVARYPESSLQLIQESVTDPDTLHFCLRHAAYHLTQKNLDVVRKFISETDDMWKTRSLVSGVIDYSVQDGNVNYAASVLRALPAGSVLADSARQILCAVARKGSEDPSVILGSLPQSMRDTVVERSVSKLLTESGEAPLKAMNLLSVMTDASLAADRARDAGSRLAAADLGPAVNMIEKVQSDAIREQAYLGLIRTVEKSADSARLGALLNSNPELRRFIQQ